MRDARIMTFEIEGVPVILKIDSGADANLITASDWDRLKGRGTVEPLKNAPEVSLVDYNGRAIPIKASFEAEIRISGSVSSSAKAKFYVAASRPQAVLSYETSLELGVLKIGKSIDQVGAMVKRFPIMPIEPIKFEVIGSVRPRLCIYNNIPAAFEQEIEKYWEGLEAQGIIEAVKGIPVWLSRVEVVPKKLGGYRVVIDMRAANEAIKRIHYPMPNQEKLLAKLGNAKFYSKIDFTSAYFHVPVEEDSRFLTAFMTNKGAMQYTRLPFGINCAPEIFQKIMDQSFRQIKGVLVYLDDLLLFGDSIEELRKVTEKVLQKIKTSNLTINKEKCEWEVQKIGFLGLVITPEGITPADEKVKAITDFPTPQTFAQLRGFLGLVTFIAKHLFDLSTETAPLRELLVGESRTLKGNKQLPYWNDEQQQAFGNLKAMAANEVIVRGHFKENTKTEIITDASLKGISALVVQEDEEGKTRVIACASKSLTRTEQAYPQTHREALAIVWGVEKFHYYLAGRKFTIVTDHEPMKYIFGNSCCKTNKRAITRAEGWALRLSPYDYDVRTIAGSTNIADVLSRQLPETVEKEDVHMVEHLSVASVQKEQNHQRWLNGSIKLNVLAVYELTRLISLERLRQETNQDQELQQLANSLKLGVWTEETKKYRQYETELSAHTELMLRGDRIIIPISLQNEMIGIAHQSHPGMSTTKHMLRANVWWLGMDRHVENYIKNCQTCIELSRDDLPEPMVMSTMPEGPWSKLALDFWSTSAINEKVLVVADYYSRFIEALVMKETTAEATIKTLTALFQKRGWPDTLKHDNGPQFASATFREWAEEHMMKLNPTTPRFAQENGLVERHMKGITRALAIAKVENTEWKQTLEQYVDNYNSWPHSVTLIPPRDLLNGRVLRGQLPQLIKPKRLTKDMYDSMAREADLAHKAKKKEKEDRRRRAKPSDIATGDYVHVKRDLRSSKIDSNFTSKKFLVLARSGGRVVLDYFGKKLIRKTVHLKKGKNIEDGKQEEGEGTTEEDQMGSPEKQPRETRARKPNSKYVGEQWVNLVNTDSL